MAASPLYETEPVGDVPQGPYLNAVAVLLTAAAPLDLLAALLAAERRAGRERRVRWGPRTLDLDLLVYGGVVVDAAGLSVPHPRMLERRFVLEPLLAVWPDAPVPGAVAALAALPAGGVDMVSGPEWVEAAG